MTSLSLFYPISPGFFFFGGLFVEVGVDSFFHSFALTSKILASAISKYSLESSMPINLRLRFLQATPVVPLSKIIFIYFFYPFIEVFFRLCMFSKIANLTTRNTIFICISYIIINSINTIYFQNMP